MEQEGHLFVKKKGLFESWKKKWVRLSFEPNEMRIFDTRDSSEPTDATVVEGSDTIELVQNVGKTQEWVIMLEQENQQIAWQFATETEADRTFWAIHFQQAILTAPKTDKARILYKEYFNIEDTANALRQQLAVADKTYQGDGQTFLTPETLAEAQQQMAMLMEYMSQLQRKFGQQSHWEAILAPFENLVPRAGMTLSKMQTKMSVHQELEAYARERQLVTQLLRTGKLGRAQSHWDNAVKHASHLLNDNKFRVAASGKKSRAKSFITNTKSSLSADLPGKAKAKKLELELMPEIQIFKQEHLQHSAAIAELFVVAEEKHKFWSWYLLSDRVTQAFAAVDRILSVCYCSYLPPYNFPPLLNSTVVLRAQEAVESVRAASDRFVTAISSVAKPRYQLRGAAARQVAQGKQGTANAATAVDVIRNKERTRAETFVAEAAQQWQLAQEKVTLFQAVAEDYEAMHTFNVSAHHALQLYMAGLTDQANSVWEACLADSSSVFAACLMDIDLDSADTSLFARACHVRYTFEQQCFSSYVAQLTQRVDMFKARAVTAAHTGVSAGVPAQDAAAASTSGQDSKKVEGGAGEGAGGAEVQDPLCPEEQLRQSLWWVEQLVSAVPGPLPAVAVAHPPLFFSPSSPPMPAVGSHTEFCVSSELVSTANAAVNSSAHHLTALQQAYSTCDEMEPLFSECRKRLARAEAGVKVLAQRSHIHSQIARYVALSQQLEYLLSPTGLQESKIVGGQLPQESQAQHNGVLWRGLQEISTHLSSELATVEAAGGVWANKALTSDLHLFLKIQREKQVLLGLDGSTTSATNTATSSSNNNSSSSSVKPAQRGRLASPAPVSSSSSSSTGTGTQIRKIQEGNAEKNRLLLSKTASSGSGHSSSDSNPFGSTEPAASSTDELPGEVPSNPFATDAFYTPSPDKARAEPAQAVEPEAPVSSNPFD